MRTSFLAAMALLAASGAAAPAATLDLSGLPRGDNGAVVTLPNATLFGNEYVLVRSTEEGRYVCGTNLAQCVGFLTISFSNPVAGLSFNAVDVGGLQAEVVARDDMFRELARLSITAPGRQGFGALGGISSVAFGGPRPFGAVGAFGDFTFEQQSAAAAIPLPGALPLFAGAVGALALVARRRKA